MKLATLLTLTLLSAACVQAAGKKIAYTVDGATFEGYYVSPSPAAGLVLLIHDWDGLTDYEVKRSEMLADRGYAVFAADLFGTGIRPETSEERQRLTGALYKDRAKMRRLMRGALAEAKKQGADTKNAVATGYCFGGTAVLELAMSGENLKGFVPFHGGLEVPAGRDYSAAKGKVLVFHGSADTSVTLEHFAALASELEKRKVAHEMITYGGAPHAFSVFGSDRYREAADKASWLRFCEFLKEALQ
jgi:dienelactone hydrolase